MWENIPETSRELALTPFSDSILSCHASLYRYARSLCSDPAAAEELVQETYRKALSAKRKPAPATADNVRPWLFTVMRNAWANELRRQSRHPESWLEDTCADAESPEVLIDKKLLVSEVREAVDSMPVAWREIIVLREIEELPYTEIAAVLGCPVGTVMSRLARARAALRRLLIARVPDSQEARP